MKGSKSEFSEKNDQFEQFYAKIDAINQKTGNEWHFSGNTILTTMAIEYNAVFAFEYREINKSAISLWNFHREADKGKGSAALKSFESILQKYASEENKTVVLSFDIFGQSDTEAWLIKNGYTKARPDRYSKSITPTAV